MSFPELKIKFKDKEDFFIFKFGAFKVKKESIPFWSSFELKTCPGNIKFGPNIGYCRLSVEIEIRINYFFQLCMVHVIALAWPKGPNYL